MADEVILKNLVENHERYTQSPIANSILEDWENQLNYFVKVMPHEYRRALNEMHQAKTKEAA